MNLFLWKEELVTDPDVALAKAREGAAYLDRRVGKHWHQLINVDRLDIGSPFTCMLAQLNFQGYWIMPLPRRAVSCGFACGVFLDLFSLVLRIPGLAWLLRLQKIPCSYELLNDAWRIVIRERFHAPVRQVAGELAEAVALQPFCYTPRGPNLLAEMPRKAGKANFQVSYTTSRGDTRVCDAPFAISIPKRKSVRSCPIPE
jgi:hypothetical protein